MRAIINPSLTTRSTLANLAIQKPVIPNESALCIRDEFGYWRQVLDCGGLQVICCPEGRKPYLSPPWISMPKEGRRFKPVSYFDVSGAVYDSSDTDVLTVLVPVGYDGVITDFYCGIVASSATNFDEGSGQLTWRLSTNGRYLRDLGNIQSTMGSLTSPSPVPRGGLLVHSHNLIKFTVAFSPAASGVINPQARIVCSITGWYWPR